MRLYGTVSITNLLDDIILRYDPGCNVSHDKEYDEFKHCCGDFSHKAP